MTKTYNLTEPEFDLLIAHYLHSLLVAMKSVQYNRSMSINTFRNQNERAITIAMNECRDRFGHIPSYEQICVAIKIYFDGKSKEYVL